VKRVAEQAARNWLAASRALSQAPASANAAETAATTPQQQEAAATQAHALASQRRPLAAGTSAAPSAAQMAQRTQIGLAAMRQQEARREMHSQASAADAAFDATLKTEQARLDSAFSRPATPAGGAAAMRDLHEAASALQQANIDGRHAAPQTRLQLHDAALAAQAFADDASVLTEGIVSGEVHSMASLTHFMKDSDMRNFDHAVDALRVPPEGLEHLSADESMAIGLYSGRMQPNEVPLSQEVFRSINTAMRMNLPEAEGKLGFLIEPLTSGLEKLPAANGETVWRGLRVAGIGDADDADAKLPLRALQQQWRNAGVITMPAPSSASASQAAYAGNVVLRMQSAERDSRLRDTSMFNHQAQQQERTFLPGTRFRVLSAEMSAVTSHYAKQDHAATSGHSWAERVGKPVLVVTLQEVPPEPSSDAVGS
jgi:hypothetical protein